MRLSLLLRCAALGACAWLPLSLPAQTPPKPHPVPSIQDTETKEQRDARMGWWREARFGLFIHWGLYAVPGGVWEGKPTPYAGEWMMHDLTIPVADYKKIAARFNPAKFDAAAWVALAQAAGMKYIVITAKHHEGFAMYKSAVDPFNIVDATPFKRDPLQELNAACQRAGIKLGFYYSQNQDWTAVGGGVIGTHWDTAQDGDYAAYLRAKAIPQLKELLTRYQPAPAIIWFDSPIPAMTPELAGEVVALLNRYPKLIWNNRLGGGYMGDTETPEQEIPTERGDTDAEACMTINGTWGYKASDTNYKPAAVLLENLVDVAGKGGNYLLNVGPDGTGTIPQPEIDRLLAMGRWLKANGESIYGTDAGPFPKAPAWGHITRKGNRLYLHVFRWPADGKLLVPLSNRKAIAFPLIAPDRSLKVVRSENGLHITLPAAAPDPADSVIVLQLEAAPKPLPAS